MYIFPELYKTNLDPKKYTFSQQELAKILGRKQPAISLDLKFLKQVYHPVLQENYYEITDRGVTFQQTFYLMLMNVYLDGYAVLNKKGSRKKFIDEILNVWHEVNGEYQQLALLSYISDLESQLQSLGTIRGSLLQYWEERLSKYLNENRQWIIKDQPIDV